MSRTIRAACAVAITALASTAGAQNVSYSQGDFVLTDWSLSIQGQSPGMNSLFTVNAGGGNPGSMLRANVHVPTLAGGGGQAAFTATNINTTFTYNPATNGAITALTFGFDLKTFAGFANGAGGFYRPAIRQNGVTYGVTGSDLAAPVVNAGWSRVSFSFLPTDNWSDPTGTSAPDFSATGGVIDFGYRFFAGGVCNAAVGRTCTSVDILTLLDNYDVSITAAPPTTTVPEPSTYALMAAGLAGVLIAKRRRTALRHG